MAAAKTDDRVPAQAIQFDTDVAENPATLYDGGKDMGELYGDGAVSGINAYQQALTAYAEEGTEGYDASGSVASAKPEEKSIERYGNTPFTIDVEDGTYLKRSEPYQADNLEAITDHDLDELLEGYEDRMHQYELDPEDGWGPLLESEAYEEDLDAVLEDLDTQLEDAYGAAVDGQQYLTELSEDIDIEEPEVYGRYLQDDDGQSYMEIAVVEQEMPDGLFGFTRPGREKVAFVNKALYKIDKEKTKLHEITHQENPHWSEFMVRSRRTRGGGDLDPRNTLSFQANNAGRIGNGSGKVRPYGTDNFGVYGPNTGTSDYTEA